MTNLVYLDGEFVPQEQARLSVQDRGFLFGDGVYEMIRAVDGALFELLPHLQRLETGLRALRIAPDGAASRVRLLEVAQRLLSENGLTTGHATVYVQITRGPAPRTHAFPSASTLPTVHLSVARFQPPEEVRRIGATAVTQPDMRWARCHLKTVNLLPNVLAKQAALEADAWEAVFVRDGFITEGSSTNVFGVRGGELFTYPDCNYILSGITRRVIIGIAAELGLPVRETPILAGEAWSLDELFITGTTTDVLPIVRLDGRPIASGAPGPVARLLQERLAERLAGAARPRPPEDLPHLSGAGAPVA